MSVTAWTQDADYSSTELGPVDAGRFMELLLAFPWAEQDRLLAKRAQAGEDWCPPGVGMKAGRSLLHIFWDDPGWLVHVELARSGRILGLIPKRPIVMDVPIEQLAEAEDIVRQFFDDYEARVHG